MDLKTEEKEYLSIKEYVERVEQNPILASHSSKILVDMIDEIGTRKSVENGETKNRYKVFDNPSENGKYSVIGNSTELNNLVDKIRGMSLEYTNDFQLLCFTGPTASGKSELKECLISEFIQYMNEKAGGMYTVEFKIDGEWKQSPVRINPLCILKDENIEKTIEDLNKKHNEDIKIRKLHSIDPISEKYLNQIQQEDEEIELENKDKIRVVRRKIKKGEGIGIIKSEDEGSPRERISGVWIGDEMEGGERNPESFSFEGLLSQGNTGISFIEEGTHHIDMIEEIIDFSKNGEIKIDNDIWLDLDTVIFIMARENLLEEIDKEFEDLSSIERRLREFKLGYLSDYKLEEKLQWKMLKNKTEIESGRPMFLGTSIGHKSYEKKIPPHGIELVSIFNVLTRIETDRIQTVMDLSEGKEEVGRLLGGLPPTFSRDLIANIVSNGDNEEVIRPDYIIDKMEEISEEDYSDIYKICSDYLYNIQEEEVIKSIMHGNRMTEENLMEYAKNAFLFSPVGLDKEPDHEYMKNYEIEKLGFSEEDDYDLDNPEDLPSHVEQFRIDKIADPLSKRVKKREFIEDEVELTDLDLYEKAMKETDWEDVKRVHHPELDLSELAKKEPKGEKNKEIREKALRVLQEEYNYTEKSAPFVLEKIINRTKNSWDDMKFEDFRREYEKNKE